MTLVDGRVKGDEGELDGGVVAKRVTEEGLDQVVDSIDGRREDSDSGLVGCNQAGQSSSPLAFISFIMGIATSGYIHLLVRVMASAIDSCLR
jgi:hypothetical protein